MIDYEFCDELIHSINCNDNIRFNELISLNEKNRECVMKALDEIIKIHPNTKYFINMINQNTHKQQYMCVCDKAEIYYGIYGSYLAILYSLLLRDIGYAKNVFTNHEYPLSMVDVDTLKITLEGDIIDVINVNDVTDVTTYSSSFKINQPITIGYHTDTHPVQFSNVAAPTIYNIVEHIWDLNHTSALLYYKVNNIPEIIRHDDFTDFIFGIQPNIEILSNKNNTSNKLHNSDRTNIRLALAKKKWM